MKSEKEGQNYEKNAEKSSFNSSCGHHAPDGSSGGIREILALAREKNPRVRVVATAIALESVGELTACMKDPTLSDAETVCLQVSRGKKAGPYHLMLGQNPVYIFTLQGGETA